MTPDERRRQQARESSKRYRECHPEYREREKERMRRVNAARDPEAERQRIAEYRATHPLQRILTDTRRNAGQRKGTT